MKVGSSEQVISVCLGTAKSRVYTPELPLFPDNRRGQGQGQRSHFRTSPLSFSPS